MPRENTISDQLEALREAGLWRSLRCLEKVGGVVAERGETFLNFSSNDYLNLAAHPDMIEAARETLAHYGCGATSSRLLSGHLDLHEALEATLAQLCGMEAALVFASGYQANIAVLTSLATQGDVIYSDALNHASIIDGCRLSRATIRVYPHKDTGTLAALLAEETATGRRIIVSDTLFSMDGDPAALKELHALAQEHEAWLVLDEAHAIGVFGDGGGLAQAAGIQPQVIVGTLSKALGSGGGFVAASAEIRALLINRGRTFIYSTGLSPANTGAALAACQWIIAHPGAGETLLRRARFFHEALVAEGLSLGPFHSQIIPIMLGENEAALAAADALFRAHILAPAIRPPTVPKGTARLRLSLTLAHDAAMLEEGAATIARCLKAGSKP